jgi:hypothetical protein
MYATLGDYSETASIAILQKDTQGSGPCPELANWAKKRNITLSEPDPDKKLKSAGVKLKTGTSRINARGLYSSITKFKMVASIWLLTNDLVPFDQTDDAVIDRLNVLAFRSSFKRSDEMFKYKEKSNVFERKTNYSTDEFATTYAMTFMHILIEHFKILQADDFNVQMNMPISLRKEIDKYVVNSSNIASWFMANYEKEEKQRSRQKQIQTAKSDNKPLTEEEYEAQEYIRSKQIISKIEQRSLMEDEGNWFEEGLNPPERKVMQQLDETLSDGYYNGKMNERRYAIPLGDIYDKFKTSDFYINSTKAYKQKTKQKDFFNEMRKHNEISVDIYDSLKLCQVQDGCIILEKTDNQSRKAKKIKFIKKSNVLLGWVEKPKERDEADHEPEIPKQDEVSGDDENIEDYFKI